MRPLRILLICRSFPHHRAGGLEWHIQDVAEGLIAAGHTVSVITTPLPPQPAVAPLEVNGDVLELGGRSGAYSGGFFAGLASSATRRWIRAQHPDIIHAQGFAGVAASPLFREIAPVLTTIHGTLWSETPLRNLKDPVWSLRWRYKHRYAFAPLWKRWLARTPPVIVDSDFTAEELRREVPAFRAPLAMVALGMNLDRYRSGDRMAARGALRLPAEAIVLAAVGRLEPVKGAELLLNAFLAVADEDPRLHLVLGGEGSLLPRLRRAVSEAGLGDRVRLPGRLPQEDVPGLLMGADLFLNADQGAPAFGLANAEALLMGTPVLTTDAGAHREVVLPPRDGALVPPRDLAAWTAAQRDLLHQLPEKEADRNNRAQRARNRFSRDTMISGLLNAYQMILAQERPAGGRKK